MSGLPDSIISWSAYVINLQPFPLDLDWYLNQSIADGTLTLTLPWVCELLVMMDAVCATLKRSKIVLAAVNNLYNQVSREFNYCYLRTVYRYCG